MLHVEYVHTRRAPPTSLAHVTLTFPNIEAPSLRFPADSMNRFLDKNSADKPYICLPFLSLSLSLSAPAQLRPRARVGRKAGKKRIRRIQTRPSVSNDRRPRKARKRARLVEQKSEGARSDPRGRFRDHEESISRDSFLNPVAGSSVSVHSGGPAAPPFSAHQTNGPSGKKRRLRAT